MRISRPADYCKCFKTFSHSGVYIVEVYGINDSPIGGVANIGHRPTVDGKKQQLEVHLFDFNADLYGKQIEIVLLSKLRDEKKFESFELLKQQIKLDAEAARVWLHQLER